MNKPEEFSAEIVMDENDEANTEIVFKDADIPEEELNEETPQEEIDPELVGKTPDEISEIERLRSYGLSTTENGFYCDNKKFYAAMVDYKQSIYKWREVHDVWLTEREAIRIHKGEKVNRKLRISDQVKADSAKLAETLTEEQIAEFLTHEEPPKPIIPDYIGKCILAIAVHLSYRPNFNGYTFKEEFIADAVECSIKYIDNFDETYKTKNPFSYFTTICWQAFVRRIQLERHQSIVKGMLIKGMTYDESMIIDDDTDKQVVDDTIRNTHRFVQIAEEEEKRQRIKDEAKMLEKEQRKRKAEEEKHAQSLDGFFGA